MHILKRSGMDHTVLSANTPCLPFLRMRLPDGASRNWGGRHPIAAYYLSIDPKGMKGWVGLVGSPIADSLLTWVVIHQLQVERRTGKVRRPKTDVLPLSRAANCSSTVLANDMCCLYNSSVHLMTMSLIVHSISNVLTFTYK